MGIIFGIEIGLSKFEKKSVVVTDRWTVIKYGGGLMKSSGAIFDQFRQQKKPKIIQIQNIAQFKFW